MGEKEKVRGREREKEISQDTACLPMNCMLNQALRGVPEIYRYVIQSLRVSGHKDCCNLLENSEQEKHLEPHITKVRERGHTYLSLGLVPAGMAKRRLPRQAIWKFHHFEGDEEVPSLSNCVYIRTRAEDFRKTRGNICTEINGDSRKIGRYHQGQASCNDLVP